MSTTATTTMVCTVCSHQSTFPKMYFSMGTRKSFNYFCGNCGTLTLHTASQTEVPPEPLVAPTNPPSAESQHLSLPHDGSPVNRFRYDANRHSVSRAQDEQLAELSAEELWKKFLDQLNVSQVPVTDFFRCDDITRTRMFSALGFEKLDQDRLLVMSKERDPKNLIASVADSPAAVAPTASPSGPTVTITTPPTEAMTIPKSPPAPSIGGLNASNFGLHGHPAAVRSGVNYSGWRPNNNASGSSRLLPHSHRAPSIPGVYMQGEHMMARCTVYPDLPAEFWCCACNCLVSSRCHVQGIHKDHPFISMRLAAETYVRDTATWTERCRTQLNITNTIIGNLHHSHGVLDQAVNSQFELLEKNVEQIIKDICSWRDQIKNDVIQQVSAEHGAIEHAMRQAQDLHQLYNDQLKEAEPLLTNMPPADQHDSTSDDWALKFLDFVVRLKQVNAEPVTMPKILVPEIRCTFASPMVMDILKHVNNPINIRLPDIIDPGYFHYPHPTTSTRTPFVLTPPVDGRQKGVIVENNRTLTRAPDTAPAHTLVTGSQIFYSGTTSWEVHIDRIGHGVGRMLAGVIIQGSDGEGVVWDGYRIVGPNEGESRTISDKFKLKAGTILRFVLELDTPASFLNCFFEKEGVARIPLPPASSGWVPAFSVFGAQDQITVVPTQGAGAMEGSIPKNTLSSVPMSMASGNDVLTRAKLEQQELMIASLQKQLETITTRIEGGSGSAAKAPNDRSSSRAPPSSVKITVSASPSDRAVTQPADGTAAIRDAVNAAARRTASTAGRTASGGGATGTSARTASGRGSASHYSPELAQLLKFVDDIK